MRDKETASIRNYFSRHFVGSSVPGAFTSTYRMINNYLG